MAENTKIEWCDHTFNPWTGCTKVSPGCANCYAEGWAKRSGIVTWGKGQPRRRTSEANWRLPLKWNREAGREWDNFTTGVTAGADMPMPRRPRVFCASLSDWLDDEAPVEWLADLLSLIHRTPHLDWLLLSKRPQNWRERLIAARGVMFADPLDVADRIDRWIDGNPWHNVWIGTTVEDQQRADERIPLLLDIPAKVRFLSCEPLLGFTDIQQVCDDNLTIYWPLVGRAISDGMNEPAALKYGGIHWVICGGESGPHARPMMHGWAACLRDQCQRSQTPFLFKQWGEWAPTEPIQSPLADILAPGMQRLGKKAAGRQLDGREWNEFPIL